MGTASVDEYVRLFRAKAEQMGEFPDKIIIGALTGTATRHRDDMSPHIVSLLESMICDPSHPAKHKLPLCYLVDSIVKNVTDPYADLFEKGLVRWFCSAYDVVDATSKKHLARVVATWEVQSVFSAEKRKEIQRYMLTGPPTVAPSSTTTTTAINPPLPSQTHIPAPLPVTPAPAPAVPPSVVPAPTPVAPALPIQRPPLPPPPPPVMMAVAPAPAPVAVPMPGVPPEVQAMIDSRMKQLLDQQLRELGETSSMTLEDLWRTNAELASGFRLVAQAQVHEELGLAAPPPPPAVSLAPAPQTLPLAQQPPPPLPPPSQQQQPQLAIQLPLRPPAQAAGAVPASTPPPWAAKAPPGQDFGRAVQLADEVVAGARGSLDASVRGDIAGAQMQAADAAGKAALLASLLGGDAAGNGGPGMHLAGLDPLDVRVLARSNPATVRKLYGEGFPFWCKQDGTRFRAQAQLDAHMDLLFRRKRARREQNGGASREWYCTGEQWMTDFGRLGQPTVRAGDGEGDGVGTAGAGGEGVGEDGATDSVDGDPDGADALVPADERFTKCRICGDRFDMFYDADEEEWMYRNACYINVTGVGEGGGEDGDEDGMGEEGEDEDGGEGVGDDGKTRQIIVHKLCLDVSGLRDRDEIAWRDLMPGTPRQRKRSADDAELDADATAEVGDEGEDGWDDTSSVVNGTIGHEEQEISGMSEGNGAAAQAKPPLKRVKAEVGEEREEMET